jgi:hypothetical protein
VSNSLTLLKKLIHSSYEFLHKTEECFRSLHERILYLEQQAWRGPSDEQVERVLRKIIAERFAEAPHFPDTQLPRTDIPPAFKQENTFLDSARSLIMSKPIVIDPASLVVEPDSVPSREYAETFQMLEARLVGYPHVDLDEPLDEHSNIKSECAYPGQTLQGRL